MTAPLRHIALQIAVTLTLAGVLGVVLFNVADFATRGVVA